MSPFSDRELLDRLAERAGIASEYYDVNGARHVTPEDTKRAVLAAMGFRVQSTHNLMEELQRWDESPWRRPCDPVVIAHEGDDSGRWSFRLAVEEREQQTLRIIWQIRDETGHVRHERESGPGLTPCEVRYLDDRRYIRVEMPFPRDLPMGYYDVTARAQGIESDWEGSFLLILAPRHCYVPPIFQEARRIWGVAVQLYALRSSRNWGIGDFGDLFGIVEWAAKNLEAGAIGLNPLHALKNTRPFHISPYSPNSRLYLNELYLDIERIPEFSTSAEARNLVRDARFRSMLENLRKCDLVDYDAVAAVKRSVLERLFAQFLRDNFSEVGERMEPTTERGRAFARYVREQGEALERFAVYQALDEEMSRLDPPVWIWQEWPEGYRHPASAQVGEFARRRRTRIRFHQYVQWVTEQQLQNVVEQAERLGMPIGLYHDLALGSDRSGADGWAFQDVLALTADCGAPPDPFAPEGQNWGLAPVNPVALRATGYRMFIELIRKNLRHGGAIRLDHVMALFRLFWIPRGLPASAGAYVHYPAEELLAIVALESVRAKTVMIGEDLGTVPDWIRERLARAKVLSYRVFYFERTRDGEWKRPADYPEQSIAVVSTHDLPTLAGFWAGEDLAVRASLGFYADECARREAWEQRQRDKAGILTALQAEGLLPDGITTDPATAPAMTPALCRAIHTYLGRTPSWLVLASLEDGIGEKAQANLPGTVEAYPNWSRKLALDLEELRRDSRFDDLAAALKAARGGSTFGRPGAV
jgi:4-alpha-glucanotransferase